MFYLWSIRNFNNLVMLTCQVMLCRHEVNNLKRKYTTYTMEMKTIVWKLLGFGELKFKSSASSDSSPRDKCEMETMTQFN